LAKHNTQSLVKEARDDEKARSPLAAITSQNRAPRFLSVAQPFLLLGEAPGLAIRLIRRETKTSRRLLTHPRSSLPPTAKVSRHYAATTEEPPMKPKTVDMQNDI